MVGKGADLLRSLLRAGTQHIEGVVQIQVQRQLELIDKPDFPVFVKCPADGFKMHAVAENIRRVQHFTQCNIVREGAFRGRNREIILLIGIRHAFDEPDMVLQFIFIPGIHQLLDKRREGDAAVLDAFVQKHVFAEELVEFRSLRHWMIQQGHAAHGK